MGTVSSSAASVLALGRASERRPLSVDVLFDSSGPRNWSMNAVELMRRMEGVIVRRVLKLAPRPGAPAPGMVERFFTVRQPALSAAEAASTAVPLERLQGVVGSDPSDIFVYLGTDPLSGSCRGLAGTLVMSLRFPGNGHGMFLWRPITSAAEIVPVAAVAHDAEWQSGRAFLTAGAPKTQGLFYLDGASNALDTAAHLLARSIQHVQDGRTTDGSPANTSDGSEDLTADLPGPSLPRYTAARLANSVSSRIRYRGKKKQWFVSWRTSHPGSSFGLDTLDPSGFAQFQGRPGMGYADPFPFDFEGRSFLFIEEIPAHERGRLVVEEIRDGRQTTDCPEVILEMPYHLSYPCVFEHSGEHFLIPESAENATVDLYRATSFPGKWTKVKTLAHDVRLVDTTPFFHEGMWYFFTAAQPVNGLGYESLLFTASALDGPWRWHPANPISFDSRRVRPAGHLRYWQGKLIRPLQDCSLDYGRAVRIMHVTRLNPLEYADEQISVIRPDWHPDAIRTHSLNASATLEATDGSRWVRA